MRNSLTTTNTHAKNHLFLMCFGKIISTLAFKDPLHACLYGETMPQGKSCVLVTS